jgi:Mrp family chromosome partitioning ATPase
MTTMATNEKKTKQKKPKLVRVIETPLPLTIASASGETGVTYPGEVIENMRYLLTRLGNKEQLPGCISMVSALREEGVTYLSLALGATIANDLMANVCVVDLNWWWPSTSSLVPSSTPGLAAAIANAVDLDEAVVPTGLRRLSLIPAGTISRESRPVIARSHDVVELLKKLRQRFDHLILDIPAILATNDSVPLASLGDACCLVIRQRATSMEDVRAALDELVHMKILGAVLNRVRYSTPKRLIKTITAR